MSLVAHFFGSGSTIAKKSRELRYPTHKLTGKTKNAQYAALNIYEPSGIGKSSGKNIADPRVTNAHVNFVRPRILACRGSSEVRQNVRTLQTISATQTAGIINSGSADHFISC